MAKSKRKSGSSTDIARWETELTQGCLNEDDWKTIVLFVIPSQMGDLNHCNVLTESISTGLRKLFSVIEYDLLIKEVKDLAHGKASKVKTSKPPPFIEIVDSIKSIVEQGEDIPPVLLAKLLKFKMLMIKQKDLDRREDERKAAEAAAKQAKQDERSRSKMGSSSGKRAKSQSPGKKKGKRDDIPPSPKKDTKLKRRGELEDTFRTIDDEPDGEGDPQHYIIVTSVYEPRVFQPLIDLGVGIDGIVKVKSETYPVKEEEEKNVVEGNEEGEEEITGEVNAVLNSEEEKRNREKVEERLQNFWNNIDTIIQDSPSGAKIKEIADLSFLVKDSAIPEGQFEEIDSEKKTEYGKSIFEYTANVCYDLLDARKRYKRYIDNLKLTHVPSLKETTACKSTVGSTKAAIAFSGSETTSAEKQTATAGIDMRYYNHLMDQVPCEAHSVPLLLDSLLRQVEATVDQKDPMNEPKPPREDMLDHSLGEYLDGKLNQLGLKKIPRSKDNIMKESSSEPVILHYGDERSRRLHYVSDTENISPRAAEERIYDCHHMKSLIHQSMKDDYLERNEKRSILMRKQQLAHFCNALENQSNFDRVLALMSLEVLPIKHVKVDGNVSSSDDPCCLNIGWDDPYTISYIDANQDFTDDSDKNIKDLRVLRNLSDYQYSEYFDSKVFPQVLDQAMEMRPYVDLYYHRGLSCLLLVLHNPRDDQLKNCKTWDTWLHSNVGFRNYLQHVAEEISEWQQDEDIREELRNMPEAPQTPPRDPSPVAIKPANRNQMITRAEMLEIREAEENKQKKKSGKSRARSKSPGKRPPSNTKPAADKREKTGSSLKRAPSARKSSRTGTARKNVRSSQEKNSDTEAQKTETTEESTREYVFHGYDVGDELVHISGETSYLFPRDGSLIKVESYEYINGNKASRTTVYKGDNTLILNVKNPTMEIDEPGKTLEVNGVTKQDDLDPAGIDKESEKYSELFHLLTTIPSVPELPGLTCEESFMTINFSDGMRIGMESLTSKRLRNRLDASLAAVAEVRESVNKLNSPGVIASTLNTKTTSPKGRRNKEEEMRRQEELGKQLEKENREKIQATINDVYNARRACLSTSNLSVSCPDGLQLTFIHDEVKNRKILSVRQEYMSKGNAQNLSGTDVRSTIMKEELSRLVTMEGTVLKYMVDGSVKVLFPDGSVCTSTSFTSQRSTFPQSGPSANVDATGISKPEAASSLKQSENLLPSKPNLEAPPDARATMEWLIVNADGERFRRTSQSNEIRLNEVVVSHATCPRTKQILETREDGVLKVRRPDRTVVVEHSDGTRITTYHVDASQRKDNETGEDECRKHEPVEYVKIECVGYVTVLINKKRQEIKTVFGNGSEIRASLNGEYEVSKPDSTRVFVNRKGETIFAPKGTISDLVSYEVGNLSPLFDHFEQNGNPPGVIMLKLADINCLSTIDHCGNKFNVSYLGISSMERGDPAKDNTISEEELAPRYFVVYKDGSAEELLRKEDYSGFLTNADKDPSAAVLKPLPRKEDGVTGITLLKPFKGRNGQIWLKSKDEADIIPSDLRERDFKMMQPLEVKTLGPKFGSNAGIAFQVGTKPVAKQPKPLIHCPRVLELRHIAHSTVMNTEERRKMIEGIENYRVFMNEQAERVAGLLPRDPRSEEERKIASQLYDKFKEMGLRSKGSPSQDSKSPIDAGNVAESYLEATKVPPSPPPQKAKPKRPLREWEEDRIDIAELKYAKEYLRSGVVPPYFDTQEGQRFLNAMQSPSEIERLAGDLAKETVHPSYRPASVTSTDSNEVARDPSSASNQSGEYYDLRKGMQPLEKSTSTDQPINMSSKTSPLDVKIVASRPENPTPAEAVSGDSGLGIHREVQSRSRPFNPTPHHALKSGSDMYSTSVKESINEMPETYHTAAYQSNEDVEYLNQASQNDIVYQDVYSSLQLNFSSKDNEQESNGKIEVSGMPHRFPSLNYTVTGEPRPDEVKIPTSIRGSKPGAIPNQKFMVVEEPVRRQVRTASVAGTVHPESTSKLRGFHLLPDHVDFGVLKEGLSYSQTVMLKNVGIDSCRFKIKQPPPSTGLKVIYNPGPVAAGMAARLDVEIFAVAVGVEGSSGVGSIGHHIEIITETDALYLPVVATILTSHEYENRSDLSLVGGPSKNTLLLSNRPSSRDALTRPRKI